MSGGARAPAARAPGRRDWWKRGAGVPGGPGQQQRIRALAAAEDTPPRNAERRSPGGFVPARGSLSRPSFRSISKCFPGSHTSPLRRPGQARATSARGQRPRGSRPSCPTFVFLCQLLTRGARGEEGKPSRDAAQQSPQSRPDPCPPAPRPSHPVPTLHSVAGSRKLSAPIVGHTSPCGPDPRAFCHQHHRASPSGGGHRCPQVLDPLLRLPSCHLGQSPCPGCGSGKDEPQCWGPSIRHSRRGWPGLSQEFLAGAQWPLRREGGQRPSVDGPMRGPAAQPSWPPAARSSSHQAQGRHVVPATVPGLSHCPLSHPPAPPTCSGQVLGWDPRPRNLQAGQLRGPWSAWWQEF